MQLDIERDMMGKKKKAKRNKKAKGEDCGYVVLSVDKLLEMMERIVNLEAAVAGLKGVEDRCFDTLAEYLAVREGDTITFKVCAEEGGIEEVVAKFMMDGDTMLLKPGTYPERLNPVDPPT